MKLALIVACAALCITNGRADDNLWKVHYSPNDSLTDCTLDSLAGDLLYVTSHGASLTVPVDSVTRLRFERRAELGGSIGKGMLIGFAAGAALGLLVAEDIETPHLEVSTSRIMGEAAIGGAWTGGWIGLASGLISAVDTRYDLRALSPGERRQRLASLIGH